MFYENKSLAMFETSRIWKVCKYDSFKLLLYISTILIVFVYFEMKEIIDYSMTL